jgi:hypothetical protein
MDEREVALLRLFSCVLTILVVVSIKGLKQDALFMEVCSRLNQVGKEFYSAWVAL